ncbi:MAG TPA: RluA family pseudouridine synthase [Verrucomicrobiae bacterium]
MPRSPTNRNRNAIVLTDGTTIPILYEDRSVLAIDKPAGWMLVPYNWDKTSRNLQLAISSAVLGGAFWARSRNIRFLKYIHRLDAETTGILLFAKSAGALRSYGELFESRRMHKRYLAVVRGNPQQNEWTCRARLGPDPNEHGRHRVVPGSKPSTESKDAETHFKVLQRANNLALIEASPITGRTHQIRLHLSDAHLPIIGDTMYGAPEDRTRRNPPMALRAVALEFQDPFNRKPVRISAHTEDFIAQFFTQTPSQREYKSP